MEECIFNFKTIDEELIEDKNSYKWIFDTLRVYVVDNYNGNGWETEIPVINNSVLDSIKDYKKTLGKGYWIDYLGPGKMHRNDEIKEEYNNSPSIKIYDKAGVTAYLISADNEAECIYEISKLLDSDPQVLKFSSFGGNVDNVLDTFPPKYHDYILIKKDDNDTDSSLLAAVHHDSKNLVTIDGDVSYSPLVELILNPFLYDILESNDVKSEWMTHASYFRDIFTGTNYEKACWILKTTLKLESTLFPFTYDDGAEDSIACRMMYEPEDFVIALINQVKDVKDAFLDDSSKAAMQTQILASELVKNAEELLSPTHYLEKLN